MALTKDEAITRLEQALNQILSCRLGPQYDYADIVCDIRHIAQTALDDTKVIADGVDQTIS